MKNLFKLNVFFVGLPIALCLIGVFKEEFLFWGLISTMLTGLFQVIAGIKLLSEEPKDIRLRIYIISVIIFFTLWIINTKIGYNDIIMYVLFPIPLLLAFYLSIIIYKKS